MSLPFKMNSHTSRWNFSVTLSILFAVFLHVLVLTAGLLLPKYFEKKPLIKEFLTVNLVNISVPLPAPATAPLLTPQPPTIKKAVNSITKPPVSKKTVPASRAIPVKIDQTTDIAPVKAISISPIKRKIKKKITPDSSVAEARLKRAKRLREQQTLESKRLQLQQEAQRAKALAETEKAAADEAVKALRKMLLADAEVAAVSTSQKPAATAQKTGGGSSDIIESQYQSTIFSSLHQHWALPDIKPWDPELTAVVVIHISKDGQIISHEFEKRSGDRVFDQFVSRTIREANPLPAIPVAMRVRQYSIGLRFKPGEIR